MTTNHSHGELSALELVERKLIIVKGKLRSKRENPEFAMAKSPAEVPLSPPLVNTDNRTMKTPNTGRKKVTPSAATSTSTPGKLRRKVTVEDGLENVSSIQRLVEYFVVVSCEPRWESKSVLASPEGKKATKTERQRNSPSSTQNTKQAPNNERQTSLNLSSLNFFRKEETSGSVNAIHASYSHDSEIESREEILPPPKPRGTWTREEQEGTEGNIRIPTTDGHDYTFQPKITARYPFTDYDDNPLNPMVTQFCYPVGEFIVPSREYEMPRVHHFVLTNEKGRKIYGTCLTVYEEYYPQADAPWRRQDSVHTDEGNEVEVTVDHSVSVLYIPRCLCILSTWPYLTAFREYLAQLYRLASGSNCMMAPIERYVMNLCMEIPAPPPGAFEVQVNILDSIIRFWAPPAKLPIAYVALPYHTLFECLDVENILHLWYCLSLERKVLLISSQYSLLTVCAEILCSLLFPMQWSHLYVPVLPRFLCPMLDAPGKRFC